jgi:hypothetical protein
MSYLELYEGTKQGVTLGDEQKDSEDRPVAPIQVVLYCAVVTIVPHLNILCALGKLC